MTAYLRISCGWIFGSRTVDGVQHDVIWRTSDGTQTWESQSRGTNDHYIAGDFVSGDVGWILSNSGTLIRTLNGGLDWETLDGFVGRAVTMVDFWDENRGAAIAGMSILTTQDGGENWSELTIPDSVEFSDVEFADAENIWAVGFRRISDWHDPANFLNVRAHSSNGGFDWDIEMVEDATLAIQEVEFFSRSIGFLTNKADNSVRRTQDEGAHWEPVPVPGSNEVKKLTATRDNNVWELNYTGLSKAATGRHVATASGHKYGLDTDDDGDRLVTLVVTIYSALFRYGSTVLGINDEISPTLPNDFSVSVWPNPFNPTTNINFDLRTNGRGVVRVYDVTGRLIETLSDDYF
ncbi:MAG: hypothetical protein IPP40_11505 [bacterium]|nr:hypothetical protein [bacterium]